MINWTNDRETREYLNSTVFAPEPFATPTEPNWNYNLANKFISTVKPVDIGELAEYIYICTHYLKNSTREYIKETIFEYIKNVSTGFMGEMTRGIK